MDGDVGALEMELASLMRRAAEVKVGLDQAEGRLPKSGVPHYSLIENAAHELGQLLSRMVQEQMLNEVVAVQPNSSKCPACGTRCSLETTSRKVLSGDGRVEFGDHLSTLLVRKEIQHGGGLDRVHLRQNGGHLFGLHATVRRDGLFGLLRRVFANLRRQSLEALLSLYDLGLKSLKLAALALQLGLDDLDDETILERLDVDRHSRPPQ